MNTTYQANPWKLWQENTFLTCELGEWLARFCTSPRRGCPPCEQMICCCNFLSSFSSTITLNDCGAKLSNITALKSEPNCGQMKGLIAMTTPGCNTAHKSQENALWIDNGEFTYTYSLSCRDSWHKSSISSCLVVVAFGQIISPFCTELAYLFPCVHLQSLDSFHSPAICCDLYPVLWGHGHLELQSYPQLLVSPPMMTDRAVQFLFSLKKVNKSFIQW